MTDLQDEVRLLESAFFRDYPHHVYTRLRSEAPVFYSERDRIWALTKYEDIRYVSRNPKLFASGYHIYSSAAAIVGKQDTAPDDHFNGMPADARARRASILDADGMESLVFADGARHSFLRKIAGYAFTPRAVDRLEDEVDALTHRLFDTIEPGTEVDFIDEVAAPVPVIMIARLLGVTDEHVDDFRRWTDAFSERGDDFLTEDGERILLEERLAAMEEFRSFFTEQLEWRRANPQDDLLTAMVETTWEGKHMSMEEMLMMTIILLIAGNETTRGLLSGSAVLLAEHPDQLDLLRRSPDLIPPAIEELLRMVTPVTHMCRTAVEDTEIRGVAVPKGAYLCLLYPAANRDEEIWERADQLDVTRAPDPTHVAFGFAEHFCLGASLARRESRIVLTRLLERFSGWQLTGEVRRANNHMTPGITRMPVVFHR